MTSSASAVRKKAAGRVTLPTTIVPSRYDLKLAPDLDAFTFLGEAKIELSTSAELGGKCNNIIMHAKELSFVSSSYVVVGGSGAKVEADEIHINTTTTTVTFIFPEALPASSKISLTVKYSGFLNNQMAGFYRSSYMSTHGEEKIMASTQFAALDARRAFPCWDEPARKAVFAVTLVVPRNLDAFSNMPESSCKSLPGGKSKEIIFMDSPVMSSYLVAFAVGEFDFVQAQTEHGVLVKVYTPQGKSSWGTFALECATKALDSYDNFFGIPYPLPKLDMVAIPEFAFGATENWGLVTYREDCLLVDPTNAPSNQKQRVCTVVAHELAHQWFGNLVTMAWWDDLWLSEGFASWAENWAADQLHPEWELWDQFTTNRLASALRLDALKSSHAIQVPIRHAEEVEQVFDDISYSKGASVVRMIKAVLGMKAFKRGLSDYMKMHAYGNTETYDLWKAWEDSSGLPVGEMMASWTEQAGFPLVRVTKETWEDDKVTLELDQTRFLSDGSSLSKEEAEKQWCIPIITCTADGRQEDFFYMREKTASITPPLSSKDGWIKLNAGQEVPMRVKPSPKMIVRMADGIKNKFLPPCDRAGILADAYALVKAGHMKPESLIKLLSSYSTEDEYIVWRGIANILNNLSTIMLNDESMSASFTVFARGLVLQLLKSVGWDDKDTDGHLTTLLRGTMVDLLSTFCNEDSHVLAEATRRFCSFKVDSNDVKSLPSNMRSSVFKIVLKNGGDEEYNVLKTYFSFASDHAEKKYVLESLGSTPDLSLKERTLEWTLSGDIKLQDIFYLMASVGRSSRQGREISWQFFQKNFESIKSMIGKAFPSLMDACFVSCAGSFCSEEKADEIDEFFKANPLPSNARKIAQTTENIKANANFFDILRNSELSLPEFWDSLS